MRRQPLSGLVDGSTLIFLLPMYPALQTINVYLGTTLVDSSAYAFYQDSGVVQFGVAPTVQPTADYTAIQLTNQQIIYYLWAGFQFMESLHKRGLALSSSNSAYAMASPTSTHIYVCQGPLAAGALPSDPLAGNLVFSTSQLQRGWLEKCAEFAYLDSMMVESALGDVDVTQRVGGIRIATAHRSSNIREAKKTLLEEVVVAMYAALDEIDPTGAHYGQAAAQIHTSYYANTWNWQNRSGILIPDGVDKW
jgi:hypothetical protein